MHQRVCLVSQDLQLFGGTILESISYGIEPVPDLSVVIRVAELAHAHTSISQMENEYDA